MSADPFGGENETQQQGTSASDFFASGSPSCRFNNIGDFHIGKIVEFEEAQQRDIQTGKPKFWPDGNPCQMLVITLQTDERDAEIDDDDGQRRLYVNKPSGMFVAIKQAVGKNKFAIGGTLAVKYVKNGKPKQAGFNAPKEYAAKYTPPDGVAPVESAPARQPASAANGAWPWTVAIQKCSEVGIDETTLKAALKDIGLTSYNAARDTIVVKKLIEDRRAQSEFAGSEPVFTDSDIPF